MKQFAPARFIVVSCAALLLASCGGGGGRADDPPAAESPNPTVNPTLTAATVTLSPSIPDVTKQKVQKVFSSIDVANPGAPLTIATQPNRDTLVMAVDADGKLLMAAMTNSATASFDASSTALALTRLAFGSMPDALSARQVNDAITSATSFPALVKLVDQAIQNGTPPSQRNDVADAVAVVSGEAAYKVSQLMTPASTAQRTAAGTVTTQSSHSEQFLEGKLPFRILNRSPSNYNVHVVGGRINVANSMQIAWEASSSAAPDVKKILPAMSRLRAFTTSLAPWTAPDPVTLQGNNGAGVSITLAQTEASKRENLAEITELLGGLFAELLAKDATQAEQCIDAVGEAVVSSEAIVELVQAPEGDSVRNHIGGLSSAAVDSAGVIEECFPQNAESLKSRGATKEFLRTASGALAELSIVDDINDGVTLISAFSQMWRLFNSSYTVFICEDPESTGETNIVNCVDEFKFEPENPALIVGAKLTPKIIPLDANDRETALPAGLEYQMLNAAVADFDAEKMTFTAKQNGRAELRVRFPFAETTGTYRFDVTDPVMRPNPLTLQAGASGQVELKAGDGRPLVTRPAGFVWQMDDSTIATYSVLSSVLGSSATTVTAVNAGNTVIKAFNIVTEQMTTGRVEVQGSEQPDNPAEGLLLQVSARLVRVPDNPGAALRVVYDILPAPCGSQCGYSFIGAYVDYNCTATQTFPDGSFSTDPYILHDVYEASGFIGSEPISIEGRVYGALPPVGSGGSSVSISCPSGRGVFVINDGVRKEFPMSASGGGASASN